MGAAALQYVGIDAGGTKTRLLVRTNGGHEEFELRRDGVNLIRHGEEHTAQLLVSLLHQTVKVNSGVPVCAVVAGIAGAGEPAAQASLVNRIRQLMGSAAPPIIEVIHDGIIALETAFPQSSGMLMIAGTGSVVLARTHDGTLKRAGGWGYLIGDAGSGFAVGRRGVTAITHAADGGPATSLGASLAKHFGIRERAALLAEVYTERWPLQHVAPIVLQASEEGDTVAREIVQEEVLALAQQAQWLRQRTPALNPHLCLAGGMAQSAHYRTMLQLALRSVLPDFRFSHQTQHSARGAASLARQIAEGTLEATALRFSDSGDYR